MLNQGANHGAQDVIVRNDSGLSVASDAFWDRLRAGSVTALSLIWNLDLVGRSALRRREPA